MTGAEGLTVSVSLSVCALSPWLLAGWLFGVKGWRVSPPAAAARKAPGGGAAEAAPALLPVTTREAA